MFTGDSPKQGLIDFGRIGIDCTSAVMAVCAQDKVLWNRWNLLFVACWKDVLAQNNRSVKTLKLETQGLLED